MGGNRHGKVRKYLNLMVTFLVSGLWHGAEWSYVIWGGLHGIYQVIGDLLMPVRKRIVSVCHVKTDCTSYKLSQIFCNVCADNICLDLLPCDTFAQATLYCKRIFYQMEPDRAV